MSFGIKILARGPHACFTRPEMKAERVSYDIITPSAAVGLISAIHWKPAIRWVIEEIHVLAPIRFETIRRNEIKSKSSRANAIQAMKSGDVGKATLDIIEERTQRSMLCLRDVVYGIKARFEMTGDAGPDDSVGKHAAIVERRLHKGQCFQQPSLGLREFAADVMPVEQFPETLIATSQRDRDFGLMLHHIEYGKGARPVFYHAKMQNGIVDVEACLAERAAA